MKKMFLWIHKRIGIFTIGLIAIFMIGMGLLMNSYSLNEAIPKITFSSKTLSYERNEPGSWQVEKSAEWIGLGKARITFQVDTILKTENPNTDVILVLDISGSMAGEKLDRVKKDSVDLLTALLSNDNNHAALITFDTESELVSGFTNDKDSLIKKISSLSDHGNTNYYQPLVHVDEILKDYSKEKDKECVVLFLTDGYPNEDIPNQIGEYKYLKSEYPWLKIHGVQYEMGEEVLDPIKEISDSQFIADMTTLNNVLFDASVVPTPYDNFVLTDFIDNEYFDLQDVSKLQSSFGKVELKDDNGVPKVTWDLSGLKSGQGATLTIDIDLKEELLEEEGLFPTNKSSKVVSQIEENQEDVMTEETPILSSHYNVIYEGNSPSGCSVSGVPSRTSHAVFETVEKSDVVPTCEGYQFKGWMIVTEGVKKLNDDYFTMPGKDVVVRAEWGRMGLSKSVEGEVYVQRDPILQRIGFESYNNELWKYQTSITKIVIEGDQTSKEGSTEELTWDISAAKDGSVRGLLVPNSDNPSTYTAYIQGLDGKVIANPDSSYLFGGNYFYSSNHFSKLTAIEGLELLDTSQVTDMSYMFAACNALISLDLSNWNKSQVTDMSGMFSYCRSLTSLKGLSSWDTSQVTDMSYMFEHCESLSNLDFVSGWDTSHVINMSYIFSYCSLLTSLDLSGWVTSQVTDMSGIFSSCSSLTNLDFVSGWDTSHVTNMSHMFSSCESLTSLDLSGWDTSQVTDMGAMFYRCSALTSVGNLNGWNTGQVTNMGAMFSGCRALTSVGDLSSWDTRQVTSMYSMFDDCRALTSLDLSSWSTGQVINMNFMFYSCNALTSVGDLSGWDTSHVTNMWAMFSGCWRLTSVGNLSGWDTSHVTNMSWMFDGCSLLINLDFVSGWETGQVTNMSDMFGGCSLLISLDLSGWDTSQVTDMSGMFSYCQTLASLDLSNWKTGQVAEMSEMFRDCESLTKLNFLSDWDTSHVTNMSWMFDGCESIISLDLSSWDTSQVTNMYMMFSDCSALTSVGNLNGWNTGHVTDMYCMFFGCSGLISVGDLSSWDTSKVTDMSSMFSGCSTLTTTISILNNSVTKYDSMFSSAATQNNAQIVVNYSSESETLVDQMIATKNNTNSNVVKASSPCVEHSVTIQGRNDIIATPSSGLVSNKITLIPTNDDYMVSSFEMNGKKINGNIFFMPNEEAVITNVTTVAQAIFESKHNPYDNNLDQEYEHTFEGANTLTVTLEYQIGDDWDYFYLYGSNEIQYGRYGGSTKQIETIIIPGDYIKILFHTNGSGNDYYGFKATIVPNYPHSITIQDNPDVVANKASAAYGEVVSLNVMQGDYMVTSFDMNGERIEGNTFIMPNEEAIITNVTVSIGNIVESNHNPYDNSLDETYEHTFEGAGSLTVTLEYQTESTYLDYIYLYDSNWKQYGKYGGTTKKTETILIPGNYIRILFHTNASYNDYYGFKATVVPNYPNSVTIQGNPNVVADKTSASYGETVTLSSTLSEFVVVSFEMNGEKIEGNTFTMPDEDVVITNIVFGGRHSIAIRGNDDIEARPNMAFVRDTVTLSSISGNCYVTSFEMNGTKIEGNTFTMPNEEVEITNIAVEVKHPIVIKGNEDIEARPNMAYAGDTVTLSSISGNCYVTSFDMNGTKIEGNTFTMPNEEVEITNIAVEVKHPIVIEGNDDIEAHPNMAYAGETVTLSSVSGNYYVTSFEMNGVEIVGNTFTMPNEETMITNVTVSIGSIIESNHNPYDNNLEQEYEHTFEGAGSLTVTLEYQTEDIDYDYIGLYDSNETEYGKYGGPDKTTETIIIPGNYIKILFYTDGSINDYYGFKAIVIPNYPHSITIQGNPNVVADKINAAYGEVVKLNVVNGDYRVASFEMNGTKIEGNTFTMPDEDVEITNIIVEANYPIVITGNEDIVANPNRAFAGDTVTLTSILENYYVTSFEMNGEKIKGNTFTMPDEEVEITNVKVVLGTIIESNHNPYDNDLDKEYEHTFEGATSLMVILEYQTEDISYDYICLYDSDETQYGEYGGETKTTETIVVSGNYIKILFHTDESVNDYYGFKATVIPIYE